MTVRERTRPDGTRGMGGTYADNGGIVMFRVVNIVVRKRVC